MMRAPVHEGAVVSNPVAPARSAWLLTVGGEIKKVSSQPIKYLIYSHHHFDHIAGGKPFKDAGATSSRTSGLASGSSSSRIRTRCHHGRQARTACDVQRAEGGQRTDPLKRYTVA